MKKKLMATCLIFLVFSISLMPIINADINSSISINHLTEVTIESYNTGVPKIYKVNLTQEKAENLELLLETIDSKINESSSIKEMVSIYKEAVVELDKLGLLPTDMSVEQAQNLVLGPFQNPKAVEKFEKIINDYPKIKQQPLEIMNVFCFIYAKIVDEPKIISSAFLLGVAIYYLLEAINPDLALWFLMFGALYYVFAPFYFYSVVGTMVPWDILAHSFGLYGYRYDTAFDYLLGYKGFRIIRPFSNYHFIFLGHAFMMVKIY